MIWANINYPNPHVTIHENPMCAQIMCHRKQGVRLVSLTPETLSVELMKFESKSYGFGASKENNDMWLKVDFSNLEIEKGVVRDVIHYLGRHYRPLSTLEAATHCEQ